MLRPRKPWVSSLFFQAFLINVALEKAQAGKLGGEMSLTSRPFMGLFKSTGLGVDL